MLILPLPARPDWSRPPIATLTIMLLCLIAFLMQGSDQERSNAAWRFYQESGTAKLEVSAYQADLKEQGKNPVSGRSEAVYRTMEDDFNFMQRLRNNRVITPANPDYAKWRRDRTHFETLRARIVTENYALNGREPTMASLFGHMFLHGDVMHLSGNMAVLFVVGYTVEAALGSFGFLALFLLGGLGAALPDVLMPSDAYRLSLGASGAISAVMAAYLVLFGRRRINFFYWLFFFFGTARWPALAILPIWLANELLQNFVFNRGAHINYMAHFAGLLSGALLISLYRWRRQGRSAEIVHRQDDDQAIASLRQRAEALVAQMQFGPAALQYKKLFAEHPQAETSLAAEYLRIARLSRQAELQADANRQLLLAAARNPKSIDPALLADALSAEPVTPKLSAEQWESLLIRLIDSRQFDAAENLLLRLFARQDIRSTILRQASRLANAFETAGQTERAAPLHRLLNRTTVKTGVFSG